MNALIDAEEQRILRSWRANAGPWSRAVRAQAIATRRLVTDRAGVEAVAGAGVRRVFDVGCGEGGLVRALSACPHEVIGVDALPALIDDARAQGGEFCVADPATLAGRHLAMAPGEAAVCNVWLLGKDSLNALRRSRPGHLGPNGWLMIQTLRRVAACGDGACVDGWRDGSWAGRGKAFSDPEPWYFRTLGSWRSLLPASGDQRLERQAPILPGAAAPCALLFIARAGRA